MMKTERRNVIKCYTLVSDAVREDMSRVNKSWKTRTSRAPEATRKYRF